ncbi:MAG: HNH endonuclease [Clostridia bacterium]|nr:HNH endonuclease [Clostridia bacterium]
MDDEDRFSFKKFWGPADIKPYVTYSRQGEHFCIYCGEISDTREHIPSKVFLSKPYPDNLAILPACKECNNSFSDDELYTEVYIDSLKYFSGYSSELREENKERIYKNTAYFDAHRDFAEYYSSELFPNNEKIKKILRKLAIGHMIYELSEGYSAEENDVELVSLQYKFLFDLSKEFRVNFNNLILMNDKKLPLIGSRVFDKIMVIEPAFQSTDSEDVKKIHLLSRYGLMCKMGIIVM